MAVTHVTEEILFKKTSQEMTAMLYESCIDNLEVAILEIQDGRLIEANGLLQKCNDILYRLGAGINYDAGVIADQLEMVYNYIADRLIEANIKKDTEIIQECLGLLRLIAEGWNEAIAKAYKETNTVRPSRGRATAYDQDFLYDDKNLDYRE